MIRKKELKPFLFTDNNMVYILNSKKTTKKKKNLTTNSDLATFWIQDQQKNQVNVLYIK